MRFLKLAALGFLFFLPWSGEALAQQVNNYWCNSATAPCPPSAWTPTSAANPMPVTLGGAVGSVTANQGTPNAGGALAWPTIDNNSAAILAGVTSAIPAGTNIIGAVFGADADNTSASHAPILAGGTADGTATGTVGVNKVDAAGNQSFANQTNVTLTDCSGTVVTGGTAVNAFTAQTALHGFTIFNYDTGHNDEVLWISFTTTAAASTAGSYPVPAPTPTSFAGGGSFTSPPGMGSNHALSVVAATSGHAFSCTWW